MSLANWYTSTAQAFRNRPFINRNDSAVAQATPAGAAQNPDGTPAPKEKKGQESLFGPNIGVVSSGPAWTNQSNKKVLSDELTQDIVKGWIEKSKQPSQPTTTLQALVNLKRPTIRLSPLSQSDEEGTGPHSHHQHGLEFEYDCDAPKCGIYVHVLVPASHPDATPAASATRPSLSKVLVFESVVDGGFGRSLSLQDGAILELGRFENPGKVETSGQLPTVSEDTVAAASSSPATPSTDPTSPNQRKSKRFTLAFRKRSHNRTASGPALAVVDAEPSATPASDAKKEEEDGIKVTIRLAALDEHSTELASPNEQVTYLHVVRFGAAPETKDAGGEDSRPWVVKVVKREATIGPHTFHLHEIYGLTSSSSSNPAPTAPVPDTSHTYPPTTPTSSIPLLNHTSSPVTATAEEDGAVSECLLCLSSPREVVLLPCRHLVACKECALNMVEFGAGGAINQPEEPVPSGDGTGDAAATGDAADGEPSTADAQPAAATTPAPTTTRRKRKAKGWFCPVCRQPYTSMLRITTSSPPEPSDTKPEDSATAAATDAPEIAVPEAVARPGILSNIARPSFLRGLSAPRGTNRRDLENQL